MDTESIGKLLGGVLSSGVAGNVSLAIAEGLKLANHLTEPDPAKRAKARRDYYLKLIGYIKEVQNANQDDVSNLVIEFTKLLDE